MAGQLASFVDLAAIGALDSASVPPDSTSGRRAERLLQLASAQVARHLGATVAEILDTGPDAAWTDEERMIIAGVVAEAAGMRLNVPAAPTTQPYDTEYRYSSILLNRHHYSSLDRLLAGRTRRPFGLSVLSTTRGDDLEPTWVPVAGSDRPLPVTPPGWLP